ncbi:hypothetical protein LGT39_07055 [Demequina sp. TTPB684]|uniref:hypothetical protein n=1 Tax=unclassified Demequina TaxID=2620311 RepID=UPI001CF4ABBD|nr:MULTISPECIES: hypothetical protein [unclassified Demequina]MCB2412606.1 hypothetical protein [Demequina sp. TTPB684]UPU89527.1 hypothetical protein LGT36_006265 [Demequina sp. TMPB413]
MSSMPAKRWSAARASMVIGSAVLLALGAGAFAAWAFVYSGDSEASYASAKEGLAQAQEARDGAQAGYDDRVKAEREAADARAREERKREVEREAQAWQDSYFADEGFENVGNNVYFRWLESSEYSCGNWDCAGFSVVAADGCPSGIYLEAAIMSGSTQVGWTNDSFAGLAPGGTAAGVFEMVTASGDSFSLTEANCY